MSTSNSKTKRFHASFPSALVRSPASRIESKLQQFRLDRVHLTWEYWATLGIASVALLICCYLLASSLGLAETVGCTGSIFNCDSVLKSSWSKWFGIPVALPALGLYLGLVCVLLGQLAAPGPQTKALLFQGWFAFSLLAGLAALWFLPIQLFVLGKLCLWCLIAHACGLTLGLLAVVRLPMRPVFFVPIGCVATVGVALLVGGQILSPSVSTYRIEEAPVNLSPPDEMLEFEAPQTEPHSEELDSNSDNPFSTEDLATQHKLSSVELSPTVKISPAVFSPNTLVPRFTPAAVGFRQEDEKQANTLNQSDRKVIFTNSQTGKRTGLTIGDWPHVGDQASDHQLIEMVDYTCSHCRTMHQTLKQLGAEGSDSFGITILVVPIHSECNPHVNQDHPEHNDACMLAKLSIAVWRADADKFEAFHDWLMEGEHPPTVQIAMDKASQFIGSEQLTSHLKDRLTRAFVEKNTQLYAMAGAGAIPKVLFETRAIVGELRSAEELRNILRTEFPGSFRRAR